MTPAQPIYRRIAEAAQGEPPLDELLRRICAVVAAGFGFDRVAISRYDPEAETVTQLAWVGAADELVRSLPTELGARPLHRDALRTGELQFERDLRGRPKADAEAIAALGVTSVLVAPLFSLGRCLGFLAADRAGRAFDLDDDTRADLDVVSVLVATFLEKALVQEQQLRLDAVKDQFIALAAHELKTPAAVIYGISSTLHERGSELKEEQRVELRETLYAQTRRLKSLVDQLLDLSRLDARAIAITPRPVDVRRHVEEVVVLVAERRSGDVVVDVEPDLRAEVDPDALDRILSNLVANALHYGEPPVEIRAEQRDRHFRLSVVDHGNGVADGVKQRLFDRFSRGLVGEGSGLGLAIARQYARAHGGDLLYEREPGHTRFELVLPGQN